MSAQRGAAALGGRRPTQPRDPSWPTCSPSCSRTCSVTRTQAARRRWTDTPQDIPGTHGDSHLTREPEDMGHADQLCRGQGDSGRRPRETGRPGRGLRPPLEAPPPCMATLRPCAWPCHGQGTCCPSWGMTLHGHGVPLVCPGPSKASLSLFTGSRPNWQPSVQPGGTQPSPHHGARRHQRESLGRGGGTTAWASVRGHIQIVWTRGPGLTCLPHQAGQASPP